MNQYQDDDELVDIVGGTADASSGTLAKKATPADSGIDVVSAPTTFDGVTAPEETAEPVTPGAMANLTNSYFSYEMLKSVAPGSEPVAPPTQKVEEPTRTQEDNVGSEPKDDLGNKIDNEAEGKPEKADAVDIEPELEPQSPRQPDAGLPEPSTQPDLGLTNTNQSQIVKETVEKETDETLTDDAMQIGDAVAEGS